MMCKRTRKAKLRLYAAALEWIRDAAYTDDEIAKQMRQAATMALAEGAKLDRRSDTAPGVMHSPGESRCR